MVQRIACCLWSFIICCGLAIFGILCFLGACGGMMCQQLCSLPALSQSARGRGCTQYLACILRVYMSSRYRYLASTVFDSAVQACHDFILSTPTEPYLPGLSRTAHSHVGTYTFRRSLRSTHARILWAIKNGPLRADPRESAAPRSPNY
jgi:hypothetical protein